MKKVIVIIGPTAVGKTKLSVELAKKLNTEIISGDSAQVYRQLDIGTAKITEDEMQGVKHHLIDIKEPTDSFSVAEFQQIVRDQIEAINDQGMIPIIAGGTGLYVRAVLYDYQFIDKGRDQSFQKQYEEVSNDALHHQLEQVDPESASQIHPNNRRRVLRALEIYETGDSTKSGLAIGEEAKLLYDSYIVGLDLKRETLYQRINDRVDIMMKQGLLEEVKTLYDKGIEVNIIGYKEFYDYFKGLISYEEAVDNLKKDTRHLAKRQLTFFRNKLPVHWYSVNLDHFEATIDHVFHDVKNWLISK